jgi:hypothetical protein
VPKAKKHSYHKCLILGTTFRTLASEGIRQYPARVLLADEISNATDASLWTAVARCAPTLEVACGIGDSGQLPPYSAPSERNFMRGQHM